MERQLFLLPDSALDDIRPAAEPPPPSWRLDEQTRDLGRRGIERARAALRKAKSQAATEQRETPNHRSAA